MSSHLAIVTFATVAFASPFIANAGDGQGEAAQGRRLLTQRFAPRPVTLVEIGDFHFVPGQLAPIHTHAAPVFGYVSKGSIYYQVAGQPPQILRTGDVFYEPVGPDIVHFDNASKTEEAIFTDFNFERDGEPFIVFPAPPTEKIDRRSFPSEQLDGATVNTMDVVEQVLRPAASLALPGSRATAYVYVAQGSVSATVRGEAPIIYLAGQTFYAPSHALDSRVVNASKADPAKLVVFELSNRAR